MKHSPSHGSSVLCGRPTDSSRQFFDALVIGGGPAGAAAAFFLAQSGWKVGLVERSSFPRRKVCGEFLSPTNRPLFAELGIAETIQTLAGPEVRRVAFFHGQSQIIAPLPFASGLSGIWGRALGREQLDTLLVESARKAGATILQPWSVIQFDKLDKGYSCRIMSHQSNASQELRCRILVAAHGSWTPGHLPSQAPSPPPRPGDLLAFKAYFRQTQLELDLMPLLAFPGGYGGMVHADQGRVSVSLCVRRDQLQRARQNRPGYSAAESLLAHVARSCEPVRHALDGAARDGSWLVAGPIRPGVRTCGKEGVFLVGNAAGEAHPAIAEGISMAMQSAWLLQKALPRDPSALSRPEAIFTAHRRYADAWRSNFAWRIQVSAAVAHWAMRSQLVRCSIPLLRLFPSLLTVGARASGKSHVPCFSEPHLSASPQALA